MSGKTLLSFINPPDVTINPGYLESYNHVPRKEAAVPPHMPVCGGMGGGSYLYNCSEKDMSDEQSLKMWKIYLINRDLENKEALPDQ